MTSAPSHASASVHEVPASNWVRSRTFTSSNAVFCDMMWALLLARTVRCVPTFHITRCSGRRHPVHRSSHPGHLARGTDDDALSPSCRRLAESVRRHRRSTVGSSCDADPITTELSAGESTRCLQLDAVSAHFGSRWAQLPE